MPRAPKPKLAVEGPSALPSGKARLVAFLAVLVSGLCGLLIGRALVDVQCRGDCDVALGLGAIAGAVLAAGGVAVVAVLVLRAMSEWKARANDPT
ncbi:MAG: hypothetical protein ACLGI2_01670 [Acidimicrobiia bacterium]